MYGGSSTSQGGADPESEPAAKPSDPVPVPAAAATAKTPEGGEHYAGAGAAEAGAEPSPKRPRSWQELSQSLIEGMTGAMRAAREGVASMIMAMAEADPFSEVCLPGTVNMMGVTYDIAAPKALTASALEASSSSANAAGMAASTASSTASSSESSLVAIGNLQFRHDMKSRLWFTYRHSMPPIVGSAGPGASHSGITSDSGWGCMLRSAQMMCAQALLLHSLGRSWRLSDAPYSEQPGEYRKILEKFADSPSAQLSIHNIAKAGEEVGKKVGQWMGPNTVCSAVQLLYQRGAFADVAGAVGGKQMQLLFFDSTDGDNTIYRSDCREALESGPLLIFVPVRLGTHNIDISYVPKVASMLGLSQSVGFIGGRPRSAHYFVATRGSLVYFLDPHTTQPCTSVHTHVGEGKAHASWHCDIQRRMQLKDIDASLTFGFYCKDEADLDDLCRSIGEVNTALGGYPAVSTAEERRKGEAGDWDDDDVEDDDEDGGLSVPAGGGGLLQEDDDDDKSVE